MECGSTLLVEVETQPSPQARFPHVVDSVCHFFFSLPSNLLTHCNLSSALTKNTTKQKKRHKTLKSTKLYCQYLKTSLATEAIGFDEIKNYF